MKGILLKRKYGYLALIIAIVVAAGVLVYQSSAPDVSARAHDEIELVQLDLVISVPADPGRTDLLESMLEEIGNALSNAGYQVDSFFDIMYLSNIGSSGEDGVSVRTGGNFDVFFEVDYKISGNRTFATEMVAMSLTSTAPDVNNLQSALDVVKSAVEARQGDYFIGHVTLIR